MQEAPIPIATATLPSGNHREWYTGIHNSRDFTGAEDIQIIDGLTGQETQVDYPFAPLAIAVINVVETLDQGGDVHAESRPAFDQSAAN